MAERQIENLLDFIQTICELDGKLIRNGADKNENLLFRGQSNIVIDGKIREFCNRFVI